jgi:hypothetical protein
MDSNDYPDSIHFEHALPTAYSEANSQPTIVGPFQTSPGQGVEAKLTNTQ